MLDYGIDGLTSTLTELDEIKTHYFGTSGPSVYNANPSIIEFSKIKIALFSFVCKSTSALVDFEDITYLELLDIDLINSKVSKIRKEVSKVVVCLHWGIEDCSYPKKEDVLLARKLIDNGVDIIIGNHTHAPQPIEKYNNGIIAYSLGNFITPNLKKLPTYYNAEGEPQSSFTKYLMLWNRISWGLLINMHTLEFSIQRFIYLNNRVIKLPFTPIDKYIRLKIDPLKINYDKILKKHLKRRMLIRKLTDFIISPHVPEKIKRIL
jgi:poly-gamma-glutamate synthesis protein (capsule biosynthesis protein)